MGLSCGTISAPAARSEPSADSHNARTSGSNRLFVNKAFHATLRQARLAGLASRSRARVGAKPTDCGSAACSPLTTSSASATSATDRPIRPMCTMLAKASGTSSRGTRPVVGLRPTTLQQAAGRRVEAPASVATASGPRPAATAAAAPLEEPAAVCSALQGLRVRPASSDQAPIECAYSGVVVLPSSIPPAARMRATTVASRSGTWSAKAREPHVVRTPAVTRLSFTENGTPCSGPSGMPARTASSAARASTSADSAQTVM